MSIVNWYKVNGLIIGPIAALVKPGLRAVLTDELGPDAAPLATAPVRFEGLHGRCEFVFDRGVLPQGTRTLWLRVLAGGRYLRTAPERVGLWVVGQSSERHVVTHLASTNLNPLEVPVALSYLRGTLTRADGRPMEGATLTAVACNGVSEVRFPCAVFSGGQFATAVPRFPFVRSEREWPENLPAPAAPNAFTVLWRAPGADPEDSVIDIPSTVVSAAEGSVVSAANKFNEVLELHAIFEGGAGLRAWSPEGSVSSLILTLSAASSESPTDHRTSTLQVGASVPELEGLFPSTPQPQHGVRFEVEVDGSVVFRTPVHHSLQTFEFFELSIPGTGLAGETEWSWLAKRGVPQAFSSVVDSPTADDLIRISGTTLVPMELVGAYAIAVRACQRFADAAPDPLAHVTPEVLYGLVRQGCPGSARRLSRLPTRRLKNAALRASNAYQVDSALSRDTDRINNIAAEIQDRGAHLIAASLRPFVTPAIAVPTSSFVIPALTLSQQLALASELQRHRRRTRFLHPSHTVFTDAGLRRLIRLRLAARIVSERHAPTAQALLTALAAVMSAAGVPETDTQQRDLGRLSFTELKSVITSAPEAYPSTEAFAWRVFGNIQTAFPLSALSTTWHPEDADGLAAKAEVTAAQVENLAELELAALDPGVRDRLTGLRRLHRLLPRVYPATCLAALDGHVPASAREITALSWSDFRQRASDALTEHFTEIGAPDTASADLSERVPRFMYQAAQRVASRADARYLHAVATRSAMQAVALGRQSGDVQTLGMPDEWMSANGPAAYLVDLLEFVERAGVDAGLDVRPGGASGARRPGLKSLSLSRANVLTEIPTIDLVNELLEHRVAARSAPDPARELPSETVGTSVERRAWPQPHASAGPATAALGAAVYPPPLPIDLSTVESELWLKQHRTSLSTLIDAVGSTSPTWVDHATRVRLGFPSGGDEINAEYAMLEDFSPDVEAPWWGEDSWESLGVTGERHRMKLPEFLRRTGLSEDDAFAIVHARSVDPFGALGWTYAHTPTAGEFELSSMAYCPVLRVSGLQLDLELQEVLLASGQYSDTFTVAVPDGATHLRFAAGSDVSFAFGSGPGHVLAHLTVGGSPAAVSRVDDVPRAITYARLMRLVRLQRRTGWSVAECDRVATAFGTEGFAEFDATQLRQMGRLCAVAERLALSPAHVADWYIGIACVGGRSRDGRRLPARWDSLFQSEAAYAPVDGRLALNLSRTDVAEPAPLADVRGPLCAGTGLAGSDLDLLQGLPVGHPWRVSADGLVNLELASRLLAIRELRTATGADLSLLCETAQLVGTPFAGPAASLTFLDALDAIRDLPVSTGTLSWWVHDEVPTTEFSRVQDLSFGRDRLVSALAEVRSQSLSVVSRWSVDPLRDGQRFVIPDTSSDEAVRAESRLSALATLMVGRLTPESLAGAEEVAALVAQSFDAAVWPARNEVLAPKLDAIYNKVRSWLRDPGFQSDPDQAAGDHAQWRSAILSASEPPSARTDQLNSLLDQYIERAAMRERLVRGIAISDADASSILDLAGRARPTELAAVTYPPPAGLTEPEASAAAGWADGARRLRGLISYVAARLPPDVTIASGGVNRTPAELADYLTDWTQPRRRRALAARALASSVVSRAERSADFADGQESLSDLDWLSPLVELLAPAFGDGAASAAAKFAALALRPTIPSTWFPLVDPAGSPVATDRPPLRRAAARYRGQQADSSLGVVATGDYWLREVGVALDAGTRWPEALEHLPWGSWSAWVDDLMRWDHARADRAERLMRVLRRLAMRRTVVSEFARTVARVQGDAVVPLEAMAWADLALRESLPPRPGSSSALSDFISPDVLTEPTPAWVGHQLARAIKRWDLEGALCSGLTAADRAFLASPRADAFDLLGMRTMPVDVSTDTETRRRRWGRFRNLLAVVGAESLLPQTTADESICSILSRCVDENSPSGQGGGTVMAVHLGNRAGQAVSAFLEAAGVSTAAIPTPGLVAGDPDTVASDGSDVVFQALTGLPLMLRHASDWNVNVDTIVGWASPTMPTKDRAMSVRQAARGRLANADWRVAQENIGDAMRRIRRDALLAWLSEHDTPPMSGPWDPFQEFLVDAYVDPWQQTTRIVFAHQTVQNLVNRVMIGLEPGLMLREEHERQWAWMKRFRTWQANRNVLLYPENWIDPTLLTNRSPIMERFDEAVADASATPEAFDSALSDYLNQLSEVASMRIASIFRVPGLPGQDHLRVHLLGRSRSGPGAWYLRTREGKVWGPWVGVPVEAHDVEPIVFEHAERVFVAWPKLRAMNPTQDPTGPANVWMVGLGYMIFDPSSLRWTTARDGGESNWFGWYDLSIERSSDTSSPPTPSRLFLTVAPRREFTRRLDGGFDPVVIPGDLRIRAWTERGETEPETRQIGAWDLAAGEDTVTRTSTGRQRESASWVPSALDAPVSNAYTIANELSIPSAAGEQDDLLTFSGSAQFLVEHYDRHRLLGPIMVLTLGERVYLFERELGDAPESLSPPATGSSAPPIVCGDDRTNGYQYIIPPQKLDPLELAGEASSRERRTTPAIDLGLKIVDTELPASS